MAYTIKITQYIISLGGYREEYLHVDSLEEVDRRSLGYYSRTVNLIEDFTKYVKGAPTVGRVTERLIVAGQKKFVYIEDCDKAPDNISCIVEYIKE